jgi:hypothetical protein
MEKAIAWDKIETILMKDYPVGHKREGTKPITHCLFKMPVLSKVVPNQVRLRTFKIHCQLKESLYIQLKKEN